jgi:glucosamine-6-phosphate deaminase
MLKTQIIDALNIQETNFLMLPTASNDFEDECRLFQETLENRGGIDLQILGLGENGHLGFNQPGTPFESETWISQMDKKLETRIRKETNTPPQVMLGGLTLGIKNIMHARKILLVAKGVNKAEIVEKMLRGPVTTDVPASILQLHPDCEFLLDTDAASRL